MLDWEGRGERGGAAKGSYIRNDLKPRQTRFSNGPNLLFMHRLLFGHASLHGGYLKTAATTLQ